MKLTTSLAYRKAGRMFEAFRQWIVRSDIQSLYIGMYIHVPTLLISRPTMFLIPSRFWISCQ